jgi:hypothetical protein
MVPNLLTLPARIVSEARSGVAFHYIESNGYSDAHKHELATTLAKVAVDAMMRDPWARVTLVTDQHHGVGISVGDSKERPTVELLRIPASWPVDHAASAIRKELSRVPIYRNHTT